MYRSLMIYKMERRFIIWKAYKLHEWIIHGLKRLSITINWSSTSWKDHSQHENTIHNHNIITLRPRHNGRHFPDAIFKWIFLNENVWFSIKISLKFVTWGPINNVSALVQIMAWRWPGDKPLSEPMKIGLLTHICITWPQWVKGMVMIKFLQIWQILADMKEWHPNGLW